MSRETRGALVVTSEGYQSVQEDHSYLQVSEQAVGTRTGDIQDGFIRMKGVGILLGILTLRLGSVFNAN